MVKVEYLKKWSKETGKTVEELQQLWDKAKADMDKYGLGDNEDAIRGAFRRKLRGSVYGAGKTKKTAQEFFGFVFGASRLIDWDEIRRTSALKKFAENPDDAILNHITDEAGNPLDNRDFMWKYGEKVTNPNFGKPLVSHAFERKVYGFARKDGTDEIKVFRMTLRNKTAEQWKGWKPFTAVRFLALIRNEDAGFYDLNPSKLTRFTAAKEAIEFEKWIRTVAHVYKLDKLDQAFDNTKDASDKWAFLEADIDYINPNIDEDRKQRSISITDDSVGLETYRVRLPQDFPVNFSEYSRVIVMGEVQKFQRKSDNSDAFAVEGFGIYPLPGKSVQMPEKTAMPAETSEEPIIIWD